MLLWFAFPPLYLLLEFFLDFAGLFFATSSFFGRADAVLDALQYIDAYHTAGIEPKMFLNVDTDRNWP